MKIISNFRIIKNAYGGKREKTNGILWRLLYRLKNSEFSKSFKIISLAIVYKPI